MNGMSASSTGCGLARSHERGVVRLWHGLLMIGLTWVGGLGWVRAELVSLDYVATVKTVTGTPFGLTLPLGTEVRGFFTYQTTAADSNASVQRGDYVHNPGSAFAARLPGTTVTGSGMAFLQVEDLTSDTFRFIDGPEILNRAGTMLRDGNADSSIALSLAITDTSGTAFANDSLPTTFPAKLGAFTGAVPPDPAHTFRLADGSGSVLFQFKSLVQRRGIWCALTWPSSMELVWTSAPGLVYWVETSTDGEHWQTTAGTVNSQGSSTVWSDDLAARFPNGVPATVLYRVGLP